MLSYQHSYHAGNLADVHKHMVLAMILAKLVEKDKPLTYMETHAGQGIYDLSSEEAEKTSEAKNGIIKLLDLNKIPNNNPYYQTMTTVKSIYGQNYYPGSPFIAKTLLRKNDEICLMELHPNEFRQLKNKMRADNIHIHKRDGYEGVLALSPPKIRRGIVFIDPSFEVKVEYEHVVKFIVKLHKKWPEAVIMLWYPILDEKFHEKLCIDINDAQLPKIYHDEKMFSVKDKGIKGSGIFVINLPFGIEDDLEQTSNTVFASSRKE